MKKDDLKKILILLCETYLITGISLEIANEAAIAEVKNFNYTVKYAGYNLFIYFEDGNIIIEIDGVHVQHKIRYDRKFFEKSFNKLK